MKIDYPPDRRYCFLCECDEGDVVEYEGQLWLVGLGRLVRLSDCHLREGVSGYKEVKKVKAKVVVEDD